MIKHNWEYEFIVEEVEEEPKKPKWEFTAREMEDLTVGCFGLLFCIALFVFGIAMLISGILMLFT